MLDRLNRLLDILIERLPHIKRWERVGVYFPGDSFPKNTIDEKDLEPGYFYILWYVPKRKGSANPYEHKKIPLAKENIDAEIKRQNEKLRAESNSS